jgi:hypothetical protein
MNFKIMEGDRAQRPVRNRLGAKDLLALNQGAVGRGRFPRAGIVDPRVAANYRPRTMLAAYFSVVGKFVMSYGRVRTEGGDVHVAYVAALPLCALVLQTLDELILVLPLPPAMPGDEAVGQVRLRPRNVVAHLGLGGFLLQLLDLGFHIAACLRLEIGYVETGQQNGS